MGSPDLNVCHPRLLNRIHARPHDLPRYSCRLCQPLVIPIARDREHFDLILLDMVMPGIGHPSLRRQGLDVLKSIRQVGINAPVFMMSGDYESPKEADALTEGALAYLHKPFDLGELDRLVVRAIASVSAG
jgi:DNA-binding NtrC family response regulator